MSEKEGAASWTTSTTIPSPIRSGLSQNRRWRTTVGRAVRALLSFFGGVALRSFGPVSPCDASSSSPRFAAFHPAVALRRHRCRHHRSLGCPHSQWCGRSDGDGSAGGDRDGYSLRFPPAPPRRRRRRCPPPALPRCRCRFSLQPSSSSSRSVHCGRRRHRRTPSKRRRC